MKNAFKIIIENGFSSWDTFEREREDLKKEEGSENERTPRKAAKEK